MVTDKVDEFTTIVKGREKFISFFIWQTARRYGHNLGRSDIEDVISDAYLTAVTRIRHQRQLEIKHPLAWFLRVVYLTLMNVLRKKRHTPEFPRNADLQDVEDTNWVYAFSEQNEKDELLAKALQDLTQDEQTVIRENLRGQNYEEIAALMGKSNAAIRQLRSRAIKKLKKKLS